MLGPAMTAIEARLAAGFTDWPVSIENQGFDPPVDGQGAKLPFVELRIVGGKNRLRGVGLPGQRLFTHPGIIYCHLCVPGGGGSMDVRAKADAIAALFERQEFGSTVRTEDASINGNIAGYADGSYFVTSVSIPFEYLYRN